MNRKNITGLRVGRLTVLSAEQPKNGRSFWSCVCDCGQQVSVSQSNLVTAQVKSCGCLRVEVTTALNLSHGHASRKKGEIKEYGVWATMKSRCYNENSQVYSHYGGRGIKVCDQWKNDFVRFLEDMGRCPTGKSLERKDNDGDYNPENCIWASTLEQANNKRSNVKVIIGGQVLSVKDCAAKLNVCVATIYRQIAKGENLDEYVNRIRR